MEKDVDWEAIERRAKRRFYILKHKNMGWIMLIGAGLLFIVFLLQSGSMKLPVPLVVIAFLGASQLGQYYMAKDLKDYIDLLEEELDKRDAGGE